jgi:hypothetical protein
MKAPIVCEGAQQIDDVLVPFTCKPPQRPQLTAECHLRKYALDDECVTLLQSKQRQ